MLDRELNCDIVKYQQKVYIESKLPNKINKHR